MRLGTVGVVAGLLRLFRTCQTDRKGSDELPGELS